MKKVFILFVVSFFLFIGIVSAYTEAPIDVTRMDINQIEQAMDAGLINSETLVKIYLERIEAYNGQFNAINQINEHAIEQAQELDRLRSEGYIKGRLHGIPVIVKCNIDVYGMPTTAGTKAMKDNYPTDDSFVVQKLIEEGAIILASANMSELAFSAADSYSSYGHVRNVFNSSYTPYGSSGGTAVSIKAGFATVGLGTDTNSSVRLPSAGAGLVGLRPTYGVLSSDGVIPYDYYRDTVGIISNSVLDNVLLFNVMTGNDYILTSSLEGVTIGVPTQYLKGSGSSGVTGTTDSEIYNIAVESIRKMEEAGATIVYLDSFVKSSNLSIASSTQKGGTMCYYFNKYLEGTTGTIRSFQQLASSGGHIQRLTNYASYCKPGNERADKKAVYRNYVDGVFEEYNLDVIIYPTLKNKVYRFGKGRNISPGSSFGSVIGYPSITVPMGFLSDGFSYGMEFLAKANEEKRLYDITSAFEEINGNVIEPSPLTPSLYEIPEEVNTLKDYYLTVLDNNIQNEWTEKVREYFANYNNEDRIELANQLIDEYLNPAVEEPVIEEQEVEEKQEKKKVDILVLIEEILLIIVLSLIIILGILVISRKRK